MDKPLRMIAEASLRRMPSYWRVLDEIGNNGQEFVSCTEIADRFHQDPTQVRKDLEGAGCEGRPRVGFAVNETKRCIAEFLGWNNTHDAFLVGAGNLGAALAGYEGFQPAGLTIVAVFDNNPEKIGAKLAGKPVLRVERFRNLAQRMHVQIGIIAVPAHAAQETADMMLESGIKAIWNFAPRKLSSPEGVVVENADLTPSLASLSAKLRMKRDQEVE